MEGLKKYLAAEVIACKVNNSGRIKKPSGLHSTEGNTTIKGSKTNYSNYMAYFLMQKYG